MVNISTKLRKESPLSNLATSNGFNGGLKTNVFVNISMTNYIN